MLPIGLPDLPAALAETDILVTCTGARSLTITAADLVGTPVIGVVDLALPADVSPDVASLGVSLINLDRLVNDQADELTSPEFEEAGAAGKTADESVEVEA
jgi:glutamyl-tRNA reductase